MGWLSVERDGEVLTYGDASLDTCARFLRSIGEEYRETELQRLPTLDEIMLNLQIVMGTDLARYCHDGRDRELVSIKARSKRLPAQPTARLGDIVAVPLADDVVGYVQVLEAQGLANGIVGVFPHVDAGDANLASLPERTFLAQHQIEITGVRWKHWRVVGNMPLPAGLEVGKFLSWSPCFVAELEILDDLRGAGLVDEELALYDSVGSSHPKMRPLHVQKLTAWLAFLRDKGLLSEDGLAAVAHGDVGVDFSLHSGLMSAEGKRFSDVAFERNYPTDHLIKDTYRRLTEIWDELHEQ